MCETLFVLELNDWIQEKTIDPTSGEVLRYMARPDCRSGNLERDKVYIMDIDGPAEYCYSIQYSDDRGWKDSFNRFSRLYYL